MNDPVKDKYGGIRPESRFKPYIDDMGNTAQRFFYDYFYHPSEYAETKRQIANRIFGMLRYPAFNAMFSAAENKLDMFECLKGKVVLGSSPKSVLGADGSQLFSRYMVALTLQAAFERITVHKSKSSSRRSRHSRRQVDLPLRAKTARIEVRRNFRHSRDRY